MSNLLTKMYFLRRRINSEETFLRRVLGRYAEPGTDLVEVGCGFARFEPVVSAAGLNYVGVDINEARVAENNERGLSCYTPESFHCADSSISCLLLAHIIEHFDYQALVEFLETWFVKLRVDGALIIFSPLPHRGFYDDFDHVKPYPPAAVRQLLCDGDQQTQHFGDLGQFEELALWFKRDSFWHSHRRSRWNHLASAPLALLHLATLARIGRLNGYGMVLRKIR